VTSVTLRCALDVMRPPVCLDHLGSDRDDEEGGPAVVVVDLDASAALAAITDDGLVLPDKSGAAALLDEVASPRTRRILELRYGFDGPPQSRREVAARIGLTAERVRQLERQGLATVRAALVPPVKSGAPPAA
jgi:DNA-directed RNA polymerase sigma subunit (sigma70/sigma32)